jgi:hypothetical protein
MNLVQIGTSEIALSGREITDLYLGSIKKIWKQTVKWVFKSTVFFFFVEKTSQIEIFFINVADMYISL